jgi:MFS family permease
MFIGSIIILIGVIAMTTGPNISSYMAGRFLTGFGVAIARSAAPSYVAEISPPQWRGPVTLLYNSLWIIGAILASAVAYGTGPMKSTLSWKLPLIIQVAPTSVVLFGCLFIPESPRWLIANDRHDEARALLAKYHDGGDMDSGLVALEMQEMDRSIRSEASDKRWYDYSELFNSKATRYRTFLVASMSFIGNYPSVLA